MNFPCKKILLTGVTLMSLKSSRVVFYVFLCAVATAALNGCLLNPGSNDFTAAPVTLMTPDPSAEHAELFSQPFAFNSSGLASSVLFSHDVHVNTQGLKCDLCHVGTAPWPISTLSVGNKTIRGNFGAKSSLKMVDLTAGKFCGICHNGTTAFNETKTFSVSGSNCYKCHTDLLVTGGPPPLVPYKGSSGFSHDVHVGQAKKTCFDCHGGPSPIWAIMTAKDSTYIMYADPAKPAIPIIDDGKGCGSCHNASDTVLDVNNPRDPTTGKSCDRCHDLFVPGRP
ncbi:hypothetical protein AUK22_10685 [bacterium CG2_30_54_10]|nr:MAG: hypothetical protein AUK22_10685 [bacterium CG2_30_54_10]